MSEKSGVGRIKWLGIFFLVFLCAGCREKTPSGGATGAAVTGAASTGGAAVQDGGDAEEDLSLSEKSRNMPDRLRPGSMRR